MFATAGGPSFTGSPLTWSIFFARQPEPDLEFTEEELEQTSNIRTSSPMKPPKNKKSGRSPLLWIVLLILIGGGGYVAMEPDMAMDLIGPLLGETTEAPPPPIARRPAPPKPPMAAIPPAQSQPQPPAAAPTAPPMDPSQTPVSAPPPTPGLPPTQAHTPAQVAPPAQGHPPTQVQAPAQAPGLAQAPTTPPMPQSSPPPMPTPARPGVPIQKDPIATAPASQPSSLMTDIQDPLFGEGQRVTLLASPGAPRQKVALMKDAAGTKPGPAVPPGTNFTILDGDLQDRGWVYYVRSDYGTKGWLNEKQLRAKR